MTLPATVDSCLAVLRAYVEANMSISQLCVIADELWDATRDTNPSLEGEGPDVEDGDEEEDLVWVVASALMGTLLAEAYDHEINKIDNAAILAVVLELIGYLEEGEDIWREKVQSGWWPWSVD